MVAMADDVDRIMAVMSSAFDPEFCEAWTRRQVEDALVLGNCHYLLAGPGGSLITPDMAVNATTGFAMTRSSFEEEELLLIAVVPDARRQGIGDQLLARFAADAKQRGATRLLLEMRRGNTADALYRRHQFVPVGLRKNYYRTLGGPRVDAITFARDIAD
jgi:ribosomal-protein-alanine N-acetyltransferase